MKTDKPNSKFIPYVFGIMGLILVVLALTIPTDTQDRVLVAVLGSAGVLGAITQIPFRKHDSVERTKPASTDVEAEEKQR